MATLFENFNTGDNAAGAIESSTIWRAQTFTAESSHAITSVKLKLYRDGAPGTITASIRATAEGLPTGSDLTSGTTDGDTLTTDTAGEWREITLASLELTSGVVYSIVIGQSNATPLNRADWRHDSSAPPYAGGTGCRSTDSGASWVSQSLDSMFEVWGGNSIDAVVTAQAVSSITTTTATGNGTVVEVGFPEATQHGVVWTTVDSPARPNLTDDSATKTEEGVPSAGPFTSAITGLTVNTTYYVRAYVTNSFGTFYGDTVEFTTTALTDPSVTTQACTSVTSSSAVGNGNVVSAGGYTISNHGIAWATHTAPVADTSVDPDAAYAETASGATGAFTEAITPLLQYTGYYVRAYVKTSTGLYFYGNEVTLSTSAGLPIVSTQLTTTISNTTATGHLTLVNTGGSAITQYGVAYSTASHADPGDVLPSASDYELYTEEGAYSVTPWPAAGVKRTSAITGLTPNTQYYLRGYATNGTGTAYGAEVSFTSKITGAPTVTTDDIFAMTYTTATVRGTILDLGASAVTVSGIAWATSANPTTADSKTTDGPTVLGQFASIATSLTVGTTYYVRAYATNTQGAAYGDNIEFVAGTPSGGAYFTPANAYTRASGIVRTFWAGSIYQAQLVLGGTSTTYISPIGTKEIPSAVEPEVQPSGPELQPVDYEKWLLQNYTPGSNINTDNMTAGLPFSKVPSYTEWIKWMSAFRRQGGR